MSDLSFDEITLPNVAPMPKEAFKVHMAPPARLAVLRLAGSWMLIGFLLGLVPLSIVTVISFLDDYSYLGGLWYAFGVVGGAAYLGFLGGVGAVIARRLR